MAARHPPCRALKPKEKDYKVTDREGMYVHVTAKGAMSFRMDCQPMSWLCQHRRQQHAVVCEPRLIADHRDGMSSERASGQFVEQSRRCHSVTDDDQRLAHG